MRVFVFQAFLDISGILPQPGARSGRITLLRLVENLVLLLYVV